MLFNSFIFLTLFLPVSIAGYYLLGARSPRAASVWLCLASFLFYGWWNPSFVLLLTLSSRPPECTALMVCGAT